MAEKYEHRLQTLKLNVHLVSPPEGSDVRAV